jgi:GT2 family glycosyltransferase
VSVAVLVIEGEDPRPTLDALARQVYGPISVVLIAAGDGTGGEHPNVAEMTSVKELADGLDPAVPYVWILHGDVRPRPDALASLVDELERNDASVAGSKILIEGAPDHLESVGGATDVFGEPYAGLDPDEVDLEQYDVVRDVAYVSGVSMLVRRDLLRGLRGIDTRLAPDAAGLDFSQRARISGGRVVVVPSSEVFHRGGCERGVAPWFELAGRMRAMFKAYQPITLLWVIPFGFLVGLIEGIGQVAMGRWRILPRHLAAAVWNIWFLPSTIAARRGLRVVRQVADEELFRYQVSGSVRLRELGSEWAERVTSALDEDNAGAAGRFLRLWTRPGALAGLVAGATTLVAARTIWLDRTPAVGMALPFANSASSTLAAYAGGWNPASLGSPEPMRAAVGAAALVEMLIGGRPGAAQALIGLAGVTAGIFGMAAFVRRLGVVSPWRHLAGLVYMGGYSMQALSGNGHWPAMIAGGAVPVALAAAMTPWPARGRGRLGRLAAIALPAGLAVVFLPAVVAVILVTGAALVLAGTGVSYMGKLAAGVGIGLGLLGPSVLLWPVWAAEGTHPAVTQPWWWLVGLASGVLVVVTLKGGVTGLGGVGGMMAFGGLLLSDGPFLGNEAAQAARLVVALGEGLLVAAMISVASKAGGFSRRMLVMVPVLILSVPLLTWVTSGRVGLPPDAWSRRLEFTRVLAPGSESDRVLLLGPEGDLPGTWRRFGGGSYRLLTAGGPTFDQAWLPTPQQGDDALAQAISEISRATTVRPGALLAPFAIRWVVVLAGENVFEEAFARQVDLAPRPVDPEFRVYENLAALPRGLGDDGSVWVWDGKGFEGRPGSGRVRLAESASPGWEPNWRQEDWAGSVSAAAGVARYRPDPKLAGAAIGSLVLLVLLACTLVWGRRR